MEAFIREHLTEIKKLARETVRREGSADAVTVELARDEFPEKTYGTLTFPEGEYDFGATEKNIVKLSHNSSYLDIF